MQEVLVQHVAAHMSEQSGIHHKSGDIATMLHTKLTSLEAPGRWQQAATHADAPLAR